MSNTFRCNLFQIKIYQSQFMKVKKINDLYMVNVQIMSDHQY
jgi:hypothetical protein